jgi:hypothetical protein
MEANFWRKTKLALGLVAITILFSGALVATIGQEMDDQADKKIVVWHGICGSIVTEVCTKQRHWYRMNDYNKN